MRHTYQCTAILFVVIFSFFTFPKDSQSQWVERWVSTYTQIGTTNEVPIDMTIDENDNIYIVGYAYNGLNEDMLLLKYDTDGDLIWKAQYDVPNSSNDRGVSVDVDDDGNVYMCGISNGSVTKLYVIKYNELGDEQWAINFMGEGSYLLSGQSPWYNQELKIGPDGKIYVAGEIANQNNKLDVLIAKIDPSGVVDWKDRYDVGYNDYSPHFVFDSQGNVIMGCTSELDSIWADYLLISYNLIGERNWTTRFTPGQFTANYVCGMAISSNDEIYVTGNTSALSSLTVKLNSSGEVQWHDTKIHQLYIEDAIVDNNDEFIIAGRKYNFSFDWDYFLIKYDNSGDTLWYRLYNSIGNLQDVGFGTTVDMRNNVYITGGMGTTVMWEQDYGTLVYDPNGNNTHLERFVPQNNGVDIARKMAFDSQNNLIITGHSHNELEGFNILTIMYSNVVGINNISSEIPGKYDLSQNFPNPFNPSTSIRFAIPKSSFVTLKVYDMLGREVATLVNQELNAGTFEYSFDGSKLTSGVYFYRIDAGDFTEIKKMMLVK